MKTRIFSATLAMAAFVASAGTDAPSSLASGNTTFAIDLYLRLAADAPRANLFYSPYSISTCMGMAYSGARGRTALEMAATLHLQPPQADVPAGFAALEQRLAAIASSGKVTLHTANSLWYQQNYHFLPEFLETGRKDFGAELAPLDIAGNPEAARLRINEWVADKTAGKIGQLLGQGILTPQTRMVLCNAIYFKGDWATQFDPKLTKPEDFFITPEQKVEVPMMSLKSKIRFAEFSGFSALELPYKGNQLSMVILLPAAKDGLAALEATLSGTNLLAWLERVGRMMERDANIQLPRFKMTSQFALAQTLGAMGMPSAFDSQADFSGMDGSRGLFISALVHQAMVEVNEEGTVAVAATGMGINLISAPPPIPTFRMDHPFVFLIRERAAGGILFVGRVTNPKG